MVAVAERERGHGTHRRNTSRVSGGKRLLLARRPFAAHRSIVRRPRFTAPEHFDSAVYHCVSRVVGRQLVLHDAEKDEFVRLMRIYERFCGLHILTFCVMGDHFHLLVEVPKRPATPMSDQELIVHVRRSKGRKEAQELAASLAKVRQAGDPLACAAERERHLRQMWDVGSFMKVLKQRFTQWFNGSRPVRRRGTLWEDRFRSVLVERGEALRTMAAYIDLNPVRAHLTIHPQDYRWCGYGEACAGGKTAKAGLHRVLEGARDSGGSLKKEWQERYRRLLEGDIREISGDSAPAVAADTDSAHAATPMHEYLRQRVRYFTDGSVLGTRDFVNGVFEAKREWFSPQRKTGARTLKGLGRASSLRTMRALVKHPLGPPEPASPPQ